MSYQTQITGGLFPITKKNYLGILQDLEEVFSHGFEWVDENGGTLKIDSYNKHKEDHLFCIFNKISDIIQPGCNRNRSLEERGDSIEDINVYFFKEGDWSQDMVDIIYPKNPFTQRNKND